MILQSLVNYYKRLQNDPDIDIPEPGYSEEKISFSLVLNLDGKLLQVKDIRVKPEKGKLRPKLMNVPKIKGRSGKNPPPYFLWDNAKYVLGVEKSKNKDELLDFVDDRFEAFKTYHTSIEYDDAGFRAVQLFLENWSREQADSITNIVDILNDTGNLVFELDSEVGYIHNRSAVKELWRGMNSNSTGVKGRCLITGEESNIAPTHLFIKGVYGGQASGGAIMSFNKTAFTSFQKKQNFNSPVGEDAAFEYTTALNYLLASKNQRIQIGDTSTVFWTEKKSPVELLFGKVIDQKDDGFSEDIRAFLKGAVQGNLPPDIDEKVPFYILGLAPNSSRISIRFWHVSTVGKMADNLGQHFRDLTIVKNNEERDPTFPGMWKLLIETAVLHKSENIPPLLAGALMRSILIGERYPASLLTLLIGRIRADGSVNYIRSAMIKAILNRKNRLNQTPDYKEVTVSLDKENRTEGYLLGRLFAVLEKIQQEAIPGANATIKDRYFGSASATPKIAFPQLMRMSQNHITKIKKDKPGRGINLDKMIGEIIDLFNDFPAHLSMDDQGLFTIGYYHQRKDLFTKKEDNQ